MLYKVTQYGTSFYTLTQSRRYEPIGWWPGSKISEAEYKKLFYNDYIRKKEVVVSQRGDRYIRVYSDKTASEILGKDIATIKL